MSQPAILDFIQSHLLAVIILSVFGFVETTIILFYFGSLAFHVFNCFCEWIGELTIKDIEMLEEGIIPSKLPDFEPAGPDVNALCGICGRQKLDHSAWVHKCPDDHGWKWTTFREATKKQYELQSIFGAPWEYERSMRISTRTWDDLTPEQTVDLTNYRDQWEEAGKQ